MNYTTSKGEVALQDEFLRRGKSFCNDKETLAAIIGDLFAENPKLVKRLRLAVQDSIAIKIAELLSRSVSEQKIRLLSIVSEFASDYAMDKVCAAEVVKVLAFGVGIAEDILTEAIQNIITLSPLKGQRVQLNGTQTAGHLLPTLISVDLTLEHRSDLDSFSSVMNEVINANVGLKNSIRDFIEAHEYNDVLDAANLTEVLALLTLCLNLQATFFPTIQKTNTGLIADDVMKIRKDCHDIVHEVAMALYYKDDMESVVVTAKDRMLKQGFNVMAVFLGMILRQL